MTDFSSFDFQFNGCKFSIVVHRRAVRNRRAIRGMTLAAFNLKTEVFTYAGKKILTKVSEEQFKSIVLVLVLITGIITLTKIVMSTTSWEEIT